MIGRPFKYAIAFHGFSQNRILIGGSADTALKQEIQRAIQVALAESDIPVEIAESGSAYNGDHPKNIVNRLTDSGVQIEQSGEARQRYWQQITDAVSSVYHDQID